MGTYRSQIQRLGYRLRYVPHEIIGEHVACCYVSYKGRKVRPRAAIPMAVPLNEIWISELWERHEERILCHELWEMEYRSKGYAATKAHKLARGKEEALFGRLG